MKLLLIRHGDPDYLNDTLTERGKLEAELLANRIAPMDVTAFYVSTLGRAQDTIRPTLERAGRTALSCEWLREFWPRIRRPDAEGRETIAWDWLPNDWLQDDRLLSESHWFEQEVFAAAHVRDAYDEVTTSFDRILAEHGYVRDGRVYRVKRPNTDTLAFFCHLGAACVILSHLLNVSPMVLWHGTAMAPTSVTTVYSEERRKGVASFRAAAIGDISHLYSAGLEPSFSARFCEVYGDGTRID